MELELLNHKPESKLPFIDAEGRIISGNGYTVAEVKRESDAHYIAQACTAYPKLLDALHALTHDGPHHERMVLINAVLEEIGEAR